MRRGTSPRGKPLWTCPSVYLSVCQERGRDGPQPTEGTAPLVLTLNAWYRTKMSPAKVKQNSRRVKKCESACACLPSVGVRVGDERRGGGRSSATPWWALCREGRACAAAAWVLPLMQRNAETP
jgi:hypothetical protein